VLAAILIILSYIIPGGPGSPGGPCGPHSPG